MTDYQGEGYEHFAYTPYGESWVSENLDNDLFSMTHRFTGQELDPETGLYAFPARNYDPRTSRWMSSDPAGPTLMVPGREGFSIIESTNWYSYVSNNPINYNDPTGLFKLDDNLTKGTVEQGDTLSQIAANYNDRTGLNLTVGDIAAHNGIENPDLIHPGDTIEMPVVWWKAVERLSVGGGASRIGDTGMSARRGTATVDFGSDWSQGGDWNGDGSGYFVFGFSAEFDVSITEEYAFGFDIGYSETYTDYFALLPLSYTEGQVMRSFTGPFETSGISTGFFGFGGSVGRTTGFDAGGLTRASAWQGDTTGWNFGVGRGATFLSRAIYSNPRRTE